MQKTGMRKKSVQDEARRKKPFRRIDPNDELEAKCMMDDEIIVGNMALPKSWLSDPKQGILSLANDLLAAEEEIADLKKQLVDVKDEIRRIRSFL